jgi:hypothetical protein
LDILQLKCQRYFFLDLERFSIRLKEPHNGLTGNGLILSKKIDSLDLKLGKTFTNLSAVNRNTLLDFFEIWLVKLLFERG